MSPWSGPDGSAAEAPEPPARGSLYSAIGDWQQEAYDRNAFTRGTDDEVSFLWDALELRPGMVLVDVGCGTGRHLRALEARGVRGIGVDISAALLTAAAARSGQAWIQADARRLPLRDATADAVLSLCQGGFGITPDGDEAVLAEMVRVLRPGGRLALTAFSLAFAARWLTPGDALDTDRGLHHTTAEVRGRDGAQRRFDLWTQCYSAGHLRTLARGRGLQVEGTYGVEPGRYARRPPALTDPELLLVARLPTGRTPA